MKIDHIGYAVKNIEKARVAFETLGFRFGELFNDHERKIYIQFGEHDGYCIELVSSNGEGEAPVDAVLGKIGPTPYHICYRSSNIDKDVEELAKQKFKVIVPLAPAIAFGGKRVVFMMNRSIGIMEIVEE